MRGFNKVKDERLLLIQLKNIRIAFVFQTISILGLIIYDWIKHGVRQMDNPLWLIFILTGTILGYLNMRISVDMESNKKSKNKQTTLFQRILYSLAIGLIFFLIMTLSGSPLREAIITGIVMVVSFTIPAVVLYFLRKKNEQDLDD